MNDKTDTVKSEAKICTKCGSEFSDDDDKRYGQCASCRNPEPMTNTSPPLTVEDATGSLEEGVAPLVLDIKKRKPPPPPVKSYYWIGVTEDSPWHYVAAGGVSFQRFMGEVRGSQGQRKYHENTHPGSPIQHLTDKHVARILENVGGRVVRNYKVIQKVLFDGTTSERITGDMIPTAGTHNRPYVGLPTDRPLGEFLWMVKVRHKDDRPMRDPPTLVPRT